MKLISLHPKSEVSERSSLKLTNVIFNFDLSFLFMCSDRSKPNIDIKMMSPYHGVQMSTEC